MTAKIRAFDEEERRADSEEWGVNDEQVIELLIRHWQWWEKNSQSWEHEAAGRLICRIVPKCVQQQEYRKSVEMIISALVTHEGIAEIQEVVLAVLGL